MLQAQCFEPLPPGTGVQAVDEAPLFCDVWELDGYCGFTYSSGVSVCPEPFCGSCENYQWFAFMAPGPVVTLGIDAYDCVGTPTGSGMQAQIFRQLEDNSFVPQSNCWSPGAENAGVVTATGLVPGGKYYLMLDGWAGDSCHYEIHVFEADSVSSIGDLGQIMGDDLPAQGAATPYSVDALPLAAGYVWTVTPADLGTLVSGEGEAAVSIHWEQSGMGELCVQAYNACEASAPACITIVVSAGLEVNFGSTPPTCVGDSDGSAWVEPLGGTPPYSYLWSTGDTLAMVNDLPAGEYIVQIVDAEGLIQVVVLEIEEPEPLLVSIMPDCEDFASLTGMAEGGVPPYTYAWNTGNDEPVQGDLQPGIYTCEVTDAVGCVQMNSFEVLEDAFTPFEANVDVPIPPVNCVNDSILFDAQDAGATAVYAWTFNPEGSVTFSNAPSLNYVPYQPGLHYAHLEVEKYGCVDDFTLYFYVTDNPEWCLLGGSPMPGPGPGGNDDFAEGGSAISQRSPSDEPPAAFAFKGLSPNPVRVGGELTLQFGAETPLPLQLRIYTAAGQQLYARELPRGIDSWNLQLTAWPAGIYRLLLFEENGKERVLEKFVVIR